MTIELGMVTIDCEDPRHLAAFWTAALEVEIEQDFGDFLVLAATHGGVRLGFQRVPEARGGKNRVHVDFGTTDREKEVKRLVELGATAHDEHSMPGITWTVLTDPEGNEFCVGES